MVVYDLAGAVRLPGTPPLKRWNAVMEWRAWLI
jgi:hypothetical protein